MKTKRLLLCTLIAGILAVIFGGSAFATAGNTAEISGGKTWNICVDAGANYAGSDFVVSIAKTDFASQIVLGNGDCKSVEMAAGTYTVSLNSTMGVGAVSYETTDDTLTFSVTNSLRKYLNTFGSIAYTVEGSGEESQFELLFSMPGECQFNGNANVSGETCKDGDGNPLTNKKYIDTNVALFSEENAGRDFEVYFTLSDYASTQEKQGTLFNAKYENSSMYYPGFTIRTVNTDGGAMEITGRLGKDNTNADKANNSIVTADIKNKEVKIVRVGGMVSYSIDGGEMIPFQDYKNFSRYFNQTAVFGASMQTNGNPQRYYDGTIKNIRVYLKKVTTASIVFDANGGTGTMAAIEDIEVGTNVTLPANVFTLQNATFDGWNTKIDGTGTAYADGATIAISAAETIRLYAQWDGRAILDSGANVNIKLKKLAGTNTSSGLYSEDKKIKAIKTASALPSGFNASSQNNIISASSDISPVPIYAWFDNSDNDGDGKGDGIIYVYTRADAIEGGNDMQYMFSYTTSLTDISSLADWDTSGATNMRQMLYDVTSLMDVSALSNWDTSSVTDMSWMFRGAEALTDISGLANWDTSSVTDMSNMFRNAESLADISSLANWNTSSVTNMSGMFGDTEISNVDALETTQHVGKDYTSWNTSSVTNMSYMFFGADVLADISGLANWDTSKVTNMSDMFASTSITNVDALETTQHVGKDYTSWNTSSVTNMSYMFFGADVLADISALASWNTSSVTNMSYMFGNTEISNVDALETTQHVGKDYTSWNTSSVTNMSYMFSGADVLADISGLANWDTSKVTNMSDMFKGDDVLADISGLANWDTSKVTNMSDMFALTSITNVDALGTKQHDGKNYVSWNTSSVKDMSDMFYWDEDLTDVSGLANWDTSSVTNMNGMFELAESLADISALANWDTSKVTNMSEMFANTSITNVDALETTQHVGKDYTSWDTSSVTNMSYMFSGAEALTDISGLANWDTSSVTNMNNMFKLAESLADISALASWNTSSVTNMSYMFAKTGISNVDALETIQHAGKDYVSWNTSSVTNMSGMFQTAKSLADISALASWNTSSVTNMQFMFGETSITNVDALRTEQHAGKNYVSWDVSRVTDMDHMFWFIASLTDISALASWNTSSVTDMGYMFSSTTSLVDVSMLENWSVSNVSDMRDMFKGVTARPLPSWYQE